MRRILLINRPRPHNNGGEDPIAQDLVIPVAFERRAACDKTVSRDVCCVPFTTSRVHLCTRRRHVLAMRL